MKKALPRVVFVCLAMLIWAILWGRFQEPASAADQSITHNCTPAGEITGERFISVMQTIAQAWNNGDAGLAASCFSEDAVYAAPPSAGHQGRNALYEYFGGRQGRELPMHMTWHNLLFDAEQQIGAGEYTFRYRIQTHGMVIVKMSNGLIRNWREYETTSNLSWDDFIAHNRF
jgi:hypothetical protein